MFEMMRHFIWSWCAIAYSIASIPPQLWPSRQKLSFVPPISFPYLIDLVDVTGKGPQIGIVRPVALTRLQLIVVVIFHALGGQEAVHHFQIGMRKTWAAGEQQQL